jgi:DnaJ-class molecular chaperone
MAEDILMTPYRTKAAICPLCRGAGWMPLVRYDAMGEQGDRCPDCAGQGYILYEDRSE